MRVYIPSDGSFPGINVNVGDFNEMWGEVRKNVLQAMERRNLSLAEYIYFDFTLGEPELEELRSVAHLVKEWVA